MEEAAWEVQCLLERANQVAVVGSVLVTDVPEVALASPESLLPTAVLVYLVEVA